LALTSLTSGGHSVGIVLLGTKATELLMKNKFDTSAEDEFLEIKISEL
jgi:hypothetical protein